MQGESLHAFTIASEKLANGQANQNSRMLVLNRTPTSTPPISANSTTFRLPKIVLRPNIPPLRFETPGHCYHAGILPLAATESELHFRSRGRPQLPRTRQRSASVALLMSGLFSDEEVVGSMGRSMSVERGLALLDSRSKSPTLDLWPEIRPLTRHAVTGQAETGTVATRNDEVTQATLGLNGLFKRSRGRRRSRVLSERQVP
jgi:hypothetical protein